MASRTRIALIIGTVVVLLADFLLPERDHPVFWWHRTPAFDLVFGFVACILIAKGSKFLAHYGLGRRKNYYD